MLIVAGRVIDRDCNLLDEIEPNFIDMVVDLVAGTIWPFVLNVLKTGGKYVASGAIAGPIIELDLRTLYLKDLTLMMQPIRIKYVLKILLDILREEG